MGLSNKILGIILAMFMLGAIGGTAWVLASNATAYAGADSSVTLIMTTFVPICGGLAVAMYMIPKRGGMAFVPQLVVIAWFTKAGRFVRLVVLKLRRR